LLTASAGLLKPLLAAIACISVRSKAARLAGVVDGQLVEAA
jgi:hypothetical protein